MSGNNTRLQAIVRVEAYQPPAPSFVDTETPGEIWADNVFSQQVMQKRLPKALFRSLLSTIENSEPLNPMVADGVATAMKDWAMEKGATHYSHVFYPLTGLSAEKHDSFFEPGAGGLSMAEFAGKTLVQGESDGSSFPSGGIRVTHEARGYTGWDPTSPAYIIEHANGKTLCIPTFFVSMFGDSLDQKTPLLRSQQAMAEQAERVLKLFGHAHPGRVVSYAGPEQEYFLIDRHFFLSRPDLLNAGRTLFGAKPPKGQEFDDHYFGTVPDRVLGFMMDTERELYKLGIPAKTRHLEVAPGQFEIAPMFERANVAADHQQLMMTTIRKIANRHGMEALFHEKPFAGVNGSGKHVNFSIGNSTEGNLLLPGDTPHDNAQFLTFCAAVIRMVHRYGGLLRASVASASNDFRLGANEAPPAIISVFLGDQLSDVFAQIAAGGATSSKGKGQLQVGVDTLPILPTDPGDRNRTSPFAFTGNRFEFRAPGSLQSIAPPMFTINTIMAEALDHIATSLETKIESGSAFNEAVQEVLAEIISEHGTVIFGGNGYSEEWPVEAEKRGLKNLRTTMDALPELITDEAVEVFTHYHVFTEKEAHSRYEVALEQYARSVAVEARSALEIGATVILPAAIRYQGEVATSFSALVAAGVDADVTTVTEIADPIAQLRAELAALKAALADEPGDVLAEATHAQQTLIPAIAAVREVADRLEGIVADDLWPLPTYQEMLYIL